MWEQKRAKEQLLGAHFWSLVRQKRAKYRDFEDFGELTFSPHLPRTSFTRFWDG